MPRISLVLHFCWFADLDYFSLKMIQILHTAYLIVKINISFNVWVRRWLIDEVTLCCFFNNFCSRQIMATITWNWNNLLNKVFTKSYSIDLICINISRFRKGHFSVLLELHQTSHTAYPHYPNFLWLRIARLLYLY